MPILESQVDRNSCDYKRNREKMLYNMYVMGKHSIERGSQDNWTITPKRIAALKLAGRSALRIATRFSA